MFFCDNPICRCHVEMPVGTKRLEYREANGNVVTTARHLVVSHSANRVLRWMFCDTCVRAVAMVNETPVDKPQG